MDEGDGNVDEGDLEDEEDDDGHELAQEIAKARNRIDCINNNGWDNTGIEEFCQQELVDNEDWYESSSSDDEDEGDE